MIKTFRLQNNNKKGMIDWRTLLFENDSAYCYEFTLPCEVVYCYLQYTTLGMSGTVHAASYQLGRAQKIIRQWVKALGSQNSLLRPHSSCSSMLPLLPSCSSMLCSRSLSAPFPRIEVVIHDRKFGVYAKYTIYVRYCT